MKKTHYYFVLLIVFLFSCHQKQEIEQEIRPDFSPISHSSARINIASYPIIRESAKGAILKEVAAGDFIQIIDLSQGARIVFLNQSYKTSISGSPACTVNNPYFIRSYLSSAWNYHSIINSVATLPNLFSLVNGSLFNDGTGTLASQTPLTYPMKVNGTIVTEGYGNPAKGDDYKFNQKMLLINGDKVAIEDYDKSIETIKKRSTPNILVGWDKYAKNNKERNYRTVVGVSGTNKVYIYSGSNKRTPDEIETLLKNEGANNFITFDGGGSTQLYCQSKAYFTQSRLIPQWIGVTIPKN